MTRWVRIRAKITGDRTYLQQELAGLLRGLHCERCDEYTTNTHLDYTKLTDLSLTRVELGSAQDIQEAIE